MSFVYFLAIFPDLRHKHPKERNRTLTKAACGVHLAIAVSYNEAIGGDSAPISELLPRKVECGTNLDVFPERV